MALRDHVREFRNRLGFALLFLLCGGAFGFFWFSTDLGPIPSLGDIVLRPYCQLELARGPDEQCLLLQTGPLDAFMTRFKVGLAAGAVLTSPGWLYQVWAFLAPGLRRIERRLALSFVTIGSVLFAAGAVLAYLVVPRGLTLLIHLGQNVFSTQFRGAEYINFVLVMLFAFGVSFLLPLLVVMLNRIGILPYDKLKHWRRGIILALCVFSAFVTPPDPLSMIALAVPMTLLFETAIQIARIQERRKQRREQQGTAGLSPDEPTPSEYVTTDSQPEHSPRSTDDIT